VSGIAMKGDWLTETLKKFLLHGQYLILCKSIYEWALLKYKGHQGGPLIAG